MVRCWCSISWMGLSCGSEVSPGCGLLHPITNAAREKSRTKTNVFRICCSFCAWKESILFTECCVTLIHDFKAIFFDYRVSQDILGNAFELFLRFFAIPAVEVEHEKFPLADVGNLRETQAREGVVNGLTLRVKHGALWHYPDVSFHKESIARAEHGFTPQ